MCDQCGRYMTKRLSMHHSDWDEDYEFESDGPRKCIYLRRQEEKELTDVEGYKKT